jgi:hypothetical protein
VVTPRVADSSRRPVRLSARLGRSVVAMFLGWVVASLTFMVCLYSYQRSFTDLVPVLFWMALFVVVGWLIVFLPLIAFIPDKSQLLSSRRLPLLGALLGPVIYFLLIGRVFLSRPLSEGLPYHIQSIIIGAVAGWFYGRRRGQGTGGLPSGNEHAV